MPMIDDDYDKTSKEFTNEGGSNEWKYKALFFLLGNASLLNFNILINAVDIFNLICKRTDMGMVLCQSFSFPSSTMALLLCFINPKKLKLALIIAFIVLSIFIITFPILLLLKTTPNLNFWLTVSFVVINGMFSPLAFSSSFSLSTQFDSKIGAYTSSGVGFGGVFAAALRIITKASFSKPSQLIVSSMCYFVITSLIILATLVFFILMCKNQDFKLKLKNIKNSKKTSICSMKIFQTLKIIWVEWLSIFFTFFITLSIFPGYLLRVKVLDWIGDWTSLVITTTFCIFDWVGRYFPALIMFPRQKYAWIPHALRLLFYPIFMLSIQRVVNLGDPWWTFVWNIPFALSNGYSSTVSFLYGINHKDLTSDDRAFSGYLMTFATNGGILIAMFMTLAISNLP